MNVSTIMSRLLAATVICTCSLAAQTLQNPILFVTQVPTPNDSATVSSLFGNHNPSMMDAPRGGALWIRYADGTTRNLTLAGGYGVSGLQGAGAIAVREPSVHWNGTKAVFSMVVGGALSQGDTTTFTWQLYEITNFAQGGTPVITKVPNQPIGFNNVSPIYGTDDRIIFTSDRTRTGETYLYPMFDEYKGTPTNGGLWSLDPSTGNLFQLDHSPSGDFSPFLDSYGRLLFMRWDRLQRDRNADFDALGTGVKGTFNYTNESITGTPQYNVRGESFPEPQGSRTDLLAGTNMVGMEFNQFFPWQINEDGTTPETLNHLGRHEMRQGINRAINDDSNVIIFAFQTSGRANQKPIGNFMQVKEDPLIPGTYYGTDALQTGTHSAGEIVSITAAPTLDPNQTVVTYVTNRITLQTTPEGGTPNPNHSGFYRNPLPLADGKLIAAHSTDTHADKNLGTRGYPTSRFAFRLKTLKKVGADWVSDQSLTAGISANITYWDTDTLVHYNGTLWELDPAEVRARTRPARRSTALPLPETQVLTEEGINEARFRLYLTRNNLAVAVSRDVTHRDALDHQQPFYLRIAGTQKQSANPVGKIYDVSHMQFYQGDLIRGLGLTSPTGTPKHGRRILAVPMHDAVTENPPLTGAPVGGVKLGNDGSMAGFVPARRATSWQLTSPTMAPVVRERYWVTFQPGEIRVCASCHGTNDGAPNPINPIPQNKPEAFRELLRFWKGHTWPAATTLRSPANDTSGTTISGTLVWNTSAQATSQHVQLATSADFATPSLDLPGLATTASPFAALAEGTQYYWRVRGENDYGDGAWSETWSFTTLVTNPLAPIAPTLRAPANNSLGHLVKDTLVWDAVPAAATYNIQLSTKADMSTPILDATGVTETTNIASGLNAGVRYFWRVSAVNGNGTGPWSEVWNFTTSMLAPSLRSPADNSGGRHSVDTLTWGSITGATKYHLQLSTKSDMSLPLLDRNDVVTTDLQVSGLLPFTRYYWRVAGDGDAGMGPWSDVWSFTTSLAAPTLLTPSNGATEVPYSGVLLWDTLHGAESYHLQLSAVPSFATTLIDQMGLGGATAPYAGLAATTTYYWRASGSAAGYDGPWSDVWSFTTSTLPSSVPATTGNAATSLELHPNPFSSGTTITFTLPRAGHAQVKVYNLLGEELTTLLDRESEAGDHTLLFTTKLANGDEIPSGLYIVQLEFDGVRNAQSLRLVR